MEIQPCSQERPSSSRRMTREACADVVGSIACCPSGQMWTSSTRLQSYGGCPDTLRQLLPLVQMSGTRHFGLLSCWDLVPLTCTLLLQVYCSGGDSVLEIE
eukprot:TRINITY_DN7005_c0_g1_i7.p1 TRINITY_DN7005_c0_g1~~TRINITY_DN7005_c0_g1_i7.p1  ORF type:complete len:101 (+),score=8.00 TRINITY_DN7005_c0_g1_i7:65-367(+)